MPAPADGGADLGGLHFFDQRLQQSGLADSRLAGEEEHAAAACSDVVEPGAELGPLVPPAEKDGFRACPRRPAGHPTSVGASRLELYAGPMPFGAAPWQVAATLVGREEELDELRRGLTEVTEGRGGLLLLAGEAGIGKTRLVEALVELAARFGLDCEWGRCWEGGGAPAYWPWRQVIRGRLADVSPTVLAAQLGPGAADVAHVAPELCERIPGLMASPPSQSADARTRLFDSVIGYLRAAARDRPFVVALDDLHAADEPSLRLLVRLGRDLVDTGLLVVGTYRDDEVSTSPRLGRLMADVARHGRVMRLTGIGEKGVAELLERSGRAELPVAVIRRVHQVTDGNPFLALEVERQLQASPGADDVRVPEDSNLLISRHLETLQRPTVALLSLAAVLGREFELSTLSTLDGRPIPALIDDLQQAERAGIVDEVGLGRWAFSHALYRERLYDDLATGARVEAHRRVAEALEDRRDEGGGSVAELAHHYLQSAAVDRGAGAVKYCAMAGDAAMASLAFEEAAQFYARALEALALAADTDGRRRYDLSTALGDARFRANDLAGAREAYAGALTAARNIGDPELVARAALGFAGMYESAQFADQSTTRVLEDALAALPERDSPVRARLLVALAGRHLAGRSPWELIGPLSKQGLEMARRAGDADALEPVLWEWHRNLFFAPETLDERVAVAEELVTSATRTGNRERLIRALHWRAADRIETGDVSGAASDLEVAEREARDLRLPLLLWGSTFPKAAIALLEGRFADAERFVALAVEAGERTEFLPVEMNYIGQLMAIRRQQGRFAELEELTRWHSEKFAWKAEDSRWALRALVLAELGEKAEAQAAFERCADVALASARAAGLRVLSVLSDLCWLLEDRERAAAVHAALRPYPGHHVLDGIVAYSLGSSDRNLALTAALLERWDEAEEHFDAAQEFHVRVGAKVWLAHTHVDRATMLLRRRRAGDEQRADELLKTAQGAFRSMGLALPAERVARMRPPSTSTTPTSRSEEGQWSLEGDHWTIGYAGTVVRLQDSKGLRYLTRLVRNPNRRFHSLELTGDDSVDGDAERARQAVRRALQSSIARIVAAHPALGEHLEKTVRSGMYSSYAPDPRAPVRWQG